MERRTERLTKELKLVKRRTFLKDVYETVEETLVEWQSIRSKWLGDNELDENGEIVTEEVSYSGGPYILGSTRHAKFVPAELSREVILEAALEIVDEQKAYEAKRDLEKQLLGEYPPKSLS